MTKQEEIREGIAGLTKGFLGTDRECNACPLTSTILFYLHSQGVVIRVGRELPTISGFTDIEPTELDKILDRFRDAYAGYVAVEPLIKEAGK